MSNTMLTRCACYTALDWKTRCGEMISHVVFQPTSSFASSWFSSTDTGCVSVLFVIDSLFQ